MSVIERTHCAVRLRRRTAVAIWSDAPVIFCAFAFEYWKLKIQKIVGLNHDERWDAKWASKQRECQIEKRLLLLPTRPSAIPRPKTRFQSSISSQNSVHTNFPFAGLPVYSTRPWILSRVKYDCSDWCRRRTGTVVSTCGARLGDPNETRPNKKPTTDFPRSFRSHF